MKTKHFFLLTVLFLTVLSVLGSNFAKSHSSTLKNFIYPSNIDSTECILKSKMTAITTQIDLFVKDKKGNIDSIKNFKKNVLAYYESVKSNFDTSKTSNIDKLFPAYDKTINKLSLEMTEEDVMRVATWDAAVRELLKRQLCK